MSKPFIIFFEKNHVYKHENTSYRSVSSLVHSVVNEFDTEFWSSYKAYEKLVNPSTFKQYKARFGYDSPELLKACSYLVDSSLFKIVQEGIVDQWTVENKQSTDKGTEFHNEKEIESYYTGAEINPMNNVCYPLMKEGTHPQGYDNWTLSDNLYELEPGFYPELLIHNEDYQIAGQADKVYISQDDPKIVDIGDYKTNKKLDRYSFKGKHGYTMLKAPLNHLMDCNLVHYQLQLSTYAWMLEQFGFRVRHLYINHKGKLLRLPYLFREVKLLLDESIGSSGNIKGSR